MHTDYFVAYSYVLRQLHEVACMHTNKRTNKQASKQRAKQTKTNIHTPGSLEQVGGGGVESERYISAAWFQGNAIQGEIPYNTTRDSS